MGVFPLGYFKNHCCILKKTYAIARKEKGPYQRAMELQWVPLPKTEQQTLSWLPNASTAYGCGRRQRQAKEVVMGDIRFLSAAWQIFFFFFGSMYDIHSGSGWDESGLVAPRHPKNAKAKQIKKKTRKRKENLERLTLECDVYLSEGYPSVCLLTCATGRL